MGMMHKIGNIWVEENDWFESILEFLFIFCMLFIFGTILYFFFYWLIDFNLTWKSYFAFNILFSLGGYCFSKSNNTL